MGHVGTFRDIWPNPRPGRRYHVWRAPPAPVAPRAVATERVPAMSHPRVVYPRPKLVGEQALPPPAVIATGGSPGRSRAPTPGLPPVATSSRTRPAGERDRSRGAAAGRGAPGDAIAALAGSRPFSAPLPHMTRRRNDDKMPAVMHRLPTIPVV